MKVQLTARRGSALLIVLGMVAFMVVSAVGFSVFMRHNRVPSSYLRRTTASRQLAKAALACAMSDIDAAVADNPHPGLGNNTEGLNRWVGRVLTPYTVSESTTVSPLTLEGLAYIPPAMVNDVRYYSRRTSTAQWKRLDYDSGRYAFCAIDVSDFFDLNRVYANRPRGSGESNLVSIAYLFEDGSHRSWGEAADPIDFHDDITKISTTGPMVSLADYNLALKSAGSSLASAFAEYIDQNGANGFYGWSTPPGKTSGDYLKYAIQRFVVDGISEQDREEWFDSRSSGSESDNNDNNPFGLSDLDISNPENQPFPELLKGDSESENDYTASQLVDIDTPFLTQRLKQINPCEAIALYDYLDRDDIPASVAVPTVERTPMIVGVEIDADSDLKVEIKSEESGESQGAVGNDGIRITKKTVLYYPKFSGGLDINAGFVFPFKYRKELNANAGDFSAEAVAYMYAIEKDQTEGNNRTCRTAIGGVMKEWPESQSGTVDYRDGLVSASSRKMTTKLPTSVESEENAVSSSGGSFHDVQMRISGFDGTENKFKSDGYIAKYFLRKRERQQDGVWVTISTGVDGWEIDPDENGGKPDFKLPVLNFKDGAMKQVDMNKTYVWGFSLAVRLFDKNSNLVDMAPAHVNDDNNQPTSDFKAMLGNLGRPVLRFDGKDGASFEVKDGLDGYEAMKNKTTSSSGGESLGLSPQTYLTDDPRYNFAAENWYSVDAGSGSLGEAWLGQITCGNSNDKDSDIFMSVSNQGYLQDPGELAFLPRVSGFNPSGGDLEMKPIISAATGKIPTGLTDLGNVNQMWRTYGCFGNLGDNEVDNLRLVSPVRGFRVNPFTDDEVVKLAPFMNTPYDWWAAGTNQTDSIKRKMINRDGTTTSPEAALKYSFSEWGSEAKVEFQYMAQLADAVSRAFRSGATDGTPWYRTWKNADWWLGDSATSICGVDLHRQLHDVDRKFLCSYWRKCYANAQQLYIVFFRAEPVVLGGGVGDGNAPAQLGARGVAVVWREPTDKTGAAADAPHRMRILFYHQFD